MEADVARRPTCAKYVREHADLPEPSTGIWALTASMDPMLAEGTKRHSGKSTVDGEGHGSLCMFSFSVILVTIEANMSLGQIKPFRRSQRDCQQMQDCTLIDWVSLVRFAGFGNPADASMGFLFFAY